MFHACQYLPAEYQNSNDNESTENADNDNNLKKRKWKYMRKNKMWQRKQTTQALWPKAPKVKDESINWQINMNLIYWRITYCFLQHVSDKYLYFIVGSTVIIDETQNNYWNNRSRKYVASNLIFISVKDRKKASKQNKNSKHRNPSVSVTIKTKKALHSLKIVIV